MKNILGIVLISPLVIFVILVLAAGLCELFTYYVPSDRPGGGYFRFHWERLFCILIIIAAIIGVLLLT